LQGGCEGPKVVLFFTLTWISHRERTLEANFCFGLVCNVIVEVQIFKKFFSLAWVGHMAKT
jgi:hypothetical protein